MPTYIYVYIYLAVNTHTHTHFIDMDCRNDELSLKNLDNLLSLPEYFFKLCPTFKDSFPVLSQSPDFYRNSNNWVCMKFVTNCVFFLFLPVICISQLQFMQYSSSCSGLGYTGDTKMNNEEAHSLVKSKQTTRRKTNFDKCSNPATKFYKS